MSQQFAPELLNSKTLNSTRTFPTAWKGLILCFVDFDWSPWFYYSSKVTFLLCLKASKEKVQLHRQLKSSLVLNKVISSIDFFFS